MKRKARLKGGVETKSKLYFISFVLEGRREGGQGSPGRKETKGMNNLLFSYIYVREGEGGGGRFGGGKGSMDPFSPHLHEGKKKEGRTYFRMKGKGRGRGK